MIGIKKDQQLEEKSFISSFIKEGWNKVKITNIESKTSSTGSVQAVFHFETEPIDDPNFKGFEGAKGKIGKASTYYMRPDNDKAIESFTTQVLTIGIKLGKENEVRAIQASTLEDYIEELNNVLKGTGYAYWMLSGEEYEKNSGGIGVRLGIPKFNFIKNPNEVTEVRMEGDTMIQLYGKGVAPYSSNVGKDWNVLFDYNSTYHYKKLEKPDKVGDDTPVVDDDI